MESVNGNKKLLEDFNKYVDKTGNEHVLQTVKIIENVLTELNYEKNKFCVSFNGGKDCTVILYLVYFVFIKKKINDTKLNCLYIELSDTFEELKKFIDLATIKYNLNLITVSGGDYKVALSTLNCKQDGCNISHIFMGTRATDSKVPLNVIQKTDPGWPEYIRVQPLLEWSYHQIWEFLLDLEVPYCSLYNQGYSSIGSKSKTQKNPKLRTNKEDGSIDYLPAYMLDDADAERHMRE